jgi:hypothetical protein
VSRIRDRKSSDGAAIDWYNGTGVVGPIDNFRARCSVPLLRVLVERLARGPVPGMREYVRSGGFGNVCKRDVDLTGCLDMAVARLRALEAGAEASDLVRARHIVRLGLMAPVRSARRGVLDTILDARDWALGRSWYRRTKSNGGDTSFSSLTGRRLAPHFSGNSVWCCAFRRRQHRRSSQRSTCLTLQARGRLRCIGTAKPTPSDTPRARKSGAALRSLSLPTLCPGVF